MTSCSAQTAQFQRMTPGYFCFTARSGKRLKSAKASRRDLLSDAISSFSTASDCRFMEAAFSSTAHLTRCSSMKQQTRLLLSSLTAGAQVVIRVGFDLFKEVRYLLTRGQPAEFASIPTLELHISFLRELILSQGLTLVEILPGPSRTSFYSVSHS